MMEATHLLSTINDDEPTGVDTLERGSSLVMTRRRSVAPASVSEWQRALAQREALEAALLARREATLAELQAARRWQSDLDTQQTQLVEHVGIQGVYACIGAGIRSSLGFSERVVR